MKRPSTKFPKLSPREAEVLDLVVLGKSSKEIGDLFGISTRTVEVFRRRIYQKIGVQDIVQLLWLTLHGELPPETGYED